MAFPPRGGEEAALRHTMFLIVSCLEHHRDETGELPRTLEEVHLDEESVRYRTDGKTFTLTASAENILINYRDGDDISPLIGDEDPILLGMQ